MAGYSRHFSGSLGLITRLNPYQILRLGNSLKIWKRRRGKEIQWARRRRLARGIAHT